MADPRVHILDICCERRFLYFSRTIKYVKPLGLLGTPFGALWAQIGGFCWCHLVPLGARWRAVSGKVAAQVRPLKEGALSFFLRVALVCRFGYA